MLLSLPNEILLMILAQIQSSNEPLCSRNTILSCRLVCKRLGNVGQGFAFQHINFLLDEIGCNRLAELSLSPLRKEVRELNCYFDPFDEEAASSKEAFENARFFSRSTKAFKEYRRGYLFQRTLKQDPRRMLHLTTAISRFYNLRAIKLSRAWSYYGEDDDLFAEPMGMQNSPIGHWLFEAITNALAMADSCVERLAMGTFWESEREYVNDYGLIGTIQRMSPQKFGSYRRAFQTLKTLKIHLPLGPLPRTMDNQDGSSLNYPGLSALIRSAVTLEELSISFSHACDNAFPLDFLPSLEIPHLRTLNLQSVTFQEPSHLLEFLERHKLTLRTICLRGLSLESGSWQTVFLGMRATLSITASSMSDFEIGNMKPLCPYDQTAVFEQALCDFIQKISDPDPFDLLPDLIGELDSVEFSDWDSVDED